MVEWKEAQVNRISILFKPLLPYTWLLEKSAFTLTLSSYSLPIKQLECRFGVSSSLLKWDLLHRATEQVSMCHEASLAGQRDCKRSSSLLESGIRTLSSCFSQQYEDSVKVKTIWEKTLWRNGSRSLVRWPFLQSVLFGLFWNDVPLLRGD